MAYIADDILVYGAGDTLEEATVDHDQNLASLLEASKKHTYQKKSVIYCNMTNIHCDMQLLYMLFCLKFT